MIKMDGRGSDWTLRPNDGKGRMVLCAFCGAEFEIWDNEICLRGYCPSCVTSRVRRMNILRNNLQSPAYLEYCEAKGRLGETPLSFYGWKTLELKLYMKLLRYQEQEVLELNKNN